MTEDERWRWRTRFVVVCMVLIAGAMAAALVTESAAGVVIVLALSTLLMAALLFTTARGSVVPPHLHGLDDDQRRLVAALANRGARAPDPVLAEAVAAHARRLRTGHILFLVSSALTVGFRLPELLAGDADAVETALVLLWLVLAGFLVRGLVRATRAISANR
jgi:hypothetical protein